MPVAVLTLQVAPKLKKILREFLLHLISPAFNFTLANNQITSIIYFNVISPISVQHCILVGYSGDLSNGKALKPFYKSFYKRIHLNPYTPFFIESARYKDQLKTKWEERSLIYLFFILFVVVGIKLHR